MPFGIGLPELTIILVIVLVIFGASRVPEVGGAIGRGIREFRKSVTSEEAFETEKDISEAPPKKKKG